MRIEYLRTAKSSYMVVKEADFCFERYEVQMILHNDIPGLLPVQIIVVDGAVEYWYDVTGMQSLEKEYAVAPVGCDRLCCLLQGICDLKTQMENYLLDDRNVVYSSRMVYFDRSSSGIRFCYLPGYRQTEETGIRMLLEEVLQNLDHTDSEAVRIGYEVYEQCARVDFVVEDVRNCLKEYRVRDRGEDMENPCGEPYADWDGGPEKEPEDLTWLEPPPPPPKKERKSLLKKRRNGRKKKRNTDYRGVYDEEQLLDFVSEKSGSYTSGNPTVYFPRERMKTVWELAYQGSGDETDFTLDKFPFLLGKDEQKADGILRASSVSRIHARITQGDDGLYLEDYNSTNGTYINGSLLPMNTPVLLHRGDRILLAAEEYVLVDRQVPT